MKILRSTKDNAEVVDEYSYKPHRKVWVTIFYVPWDPVWMATQYALTYFVAVECLYNSINSRCRTSGFQLINYVADGLFLLDLALSGIEKVIPRITGKREHKSTKPVWVMLCDLFSLLPQELFLATDDLYYCPMRVNRAFRILGLGYATIKSYKKIDTILIIQLGEYFLASTFMGVLMYALYCNALCTSKSCIGTACDTNEFILDLLSAMERVTIRPLEDYVYYHVTNGIFMLIVVMMSHFVRAIIIVYDIHKFSHQHTYVYSFRAMRHTQRKMLVPNYLRKGLLNAFRSYWDSCGAYLDTKEYLQILPPVIKNEVLIDVSWPAFKHSKLFRSMDLSLLRHLALKMTQQFFLPGEVIYRKNSLKTKMIYIVSGTVALLSEEDGESPIISLTAGTVIGECSLYVCCTSTTFVQCKTFCELHILERCDYNRLHVIFPVQFSNLREIISDRLEYAKSNNTIVTKTKISLSGIHRDIDIYTIVWLKNILHRLMAKDVESAYRHEFQNVNLLNEIKQNNLSYMLFCASNLELLAISERIEKSMDPNFARLKFPYVLHPTSIIVYIWEFIIAACSTFLAHTIPYMVFISTTCPEWYNATVFMGTFLFAFDILVQLSTSIKTHGGVLVTISSIANVRFQQFGFWVDLVACFPLEIFSPIVLKRLTVNTREILHLNRTLKIWRIGRLFWLWSKSFKPNMLVITYLKYTWLLFYMGYLVYVYLQSQNPGMRTAEIVLASLCWLRRLHILNKPVYGHDGVKALMMSGSLLVLLLFYASVSYVHVVSKLDLLKIQQVSYDLLSLLRKTKNKTHYYRVMHILETSWDTNWCIHFRDKTIDVSSLSKSIQNETMDHLFGDAIRSMQFFQCFSHEFVLDVIGITKSFIYPPKEIITYYGCISDTVYILYRGYCDLLDQDGNFVRVISDLNSINLPENILYLPNGTTCLSVTHCSVLKFTRHDFMGVLFKHQVDWKFARAFIKNCKDIKHRFIGLVDAKMKYSHRIEQKVNPSFRKFNYNLKIDSFEEFDYFLPFDKAYPFTFIRYIFMRCTFLPDGRALYIWVIIRCVLALIVNLIFFSPIVVGPHAYILDILDALCLLDVYIKLHVCYYNEVGILVSHPLKTAKKYFQTGMFMDLFALLPFRYVFNIDYNWTFSIINGNHLFQLHIYIAMVRSLTEDTIQPASKALGFLYIPILLVVWNTMANLFFCIECDLVPSGAHEDVYLGFMCHSDSILAVSNFDKPITIFRAHLIYLYTITSVMTGIGYPGYVISSNQAQIIICACIILGVYSNVIVLSNLQEMYCFRQASLLESQTAMKQLKRFLNLTVKDTKLKRIVYKTCELKWKRMKGKGIIDVVKPFPWCLRTDLLDEFYGKFLEKNTPFSTRADHFYRNILYALKFDLILKNGYIQTINDVTDNIYILLSGEADVILADGTTLDTLHAGSFYGNLSEDKMNRMHVSIIATTHVEVLYCETQIFINTLKYYQPLKIQFTDLRTKFLYYIPVKLYVKLKHKQQAKAQGLFSTAYDPNSFFIKIWSFIQLIFSSYAGLLLDIYQIGSCDYTKTIISLQYICDLLYFIYFILRDRISFEDEWGYIVSDIDIIRKRNRARKINLWLTLISLIPADVWAYSLLDDEMQKRRLYSILRLNRLLRVIYILEYMMTFKRKLDVNIFFTKFLNISLGGFLLVNVYAAVISFFSCTISPNLTPKIPPCFDIHGFNRSMTLRYYFTHFHVAWSAFMCTSQDMYFPQGTIHILLFIVTMISGYHCFMLVAAEIFALVNELNVEKIDFIELYDNMKFFLFRQGVSTSLRLRCLHYCQVQWLNNNGELFPKMLNNISPYLLDTVLNCAFASHIATHPIFAKCHTDCVRQIIQKVRHRTYYPNDYVQFRGTIDMTMYFIFDGTVYALVDEYLHNDECVSILVRGDSFGIQQGLVRTPHNYSYKCHTNTIILSLQLNHWEYLLDFFPASKDIIYQHAGDYNM